MTNLRAKCAAVLVSSAIAISGVSVASAAPHHYPHPLILGSLAADLSSKRTDHFPSNYDQWMDRLVGRILDPRAFWAQLLSVIIPGVPEEVKRVLVFGVTSAEDVAECSSRNWVQMDGVEEFTCSREVITQEEYDRAVDSVLGSSGR